MQMVDTVGAGDAFTAALTMGLLNKVDLDEVHAVAVQVARFVCSHTGATPALPEQLRNKFGNGSMGNSQPASTVHPRIKPTIAELLG